MGNQISCDIGAIFIEIVIKLKEKPHSYLNTKSYYSEVTKETFYFLSYKFSEAEEFKSHELYTKIEINSIPIKVSGITYSDEYQRLSEKFSFSFIRAEVFNYTLVSINNYWINSKENFYSYFPLAGPPADGSLTIKENDFEKRVFTETEIFPYLLVNVKSGVSIYLVTSETQAEKIGGSCLGLTSVWALLQHAGCEDLDDLLENFLNGDSSNVDMTVGDIYGCAYLNLPEKLTASTCGKLKNHNEYSNQDLIKSLLFMLLFNLGQITALHCFDLRINRVFIVGSVFVNEHIAKLMTFAFLYSSKNKIQMILCENSRFLRAMGILLKSEG